MQLQHQETYEKKSEGEQVVRREGVSCRCPKKAWHFDLQSSRVETNKQSMSRVCDVAFSVMYNLKGGAEGVTEISNHSLADLGVFREISTHLPKLSVDLLQLPQLSSQDLEFKPSSILAHQCIRTEAHSDCAGRRSTGHAAVVKVRMRCVLVEGRNLADDGCQ